MQGWRKMGLSCGGWDGGGGYWTWVHDPDHGPRIKVCRPDWRRWQKPSLLSIHSRWKWLLPRLRCHPEVTSDQTVPDESNFWSDHPRPKYPLIRLKCAQNTMCALSGLETVSDQIFPDGMDLWSDQNQTIVQTIVWWLICGRWIHESRPDIAWNRHF